MQRMVYFSSFLLYELGEHSYLGYLYESHRVHIIHTLNGDPFHPFNLRSVWCNYGFEKVFGWLSVFYWFAVYGSKPVLQDRLAGQIQVLCEDALWWAHRLQGMPTIRCFHPIVFDKDSRSFWWVFQLWQFVKGLQLRILSPLMVYL